MVDVQNALDDAGFEDKIEVSSLGKNLIFRTLEPAATSLSITVAGGNPAQQLGLHTSNVGNSHDLVITTSNGTHHFVTFGADVDTLGEVLSAISTQTGGAVTGSFSDNNTRILLADNLAQSTAVFRVNNAVGSTAAFDLAIFGFDTVEPEPEDDPRDFRIEGGQLGGVDPLDRLFIQNAQAKASLAISTPGGLDADARFGFVGIHGSGGITGLDGTGALTGSSQSASSRPTPRSSIPKPRSRSTTCSTTSATSASSSSARPSPAAARSSSRVTITPVLQRHRDRLRADADDRAHEPRRGNRRRRRRRRRATPSPPRASRTCSTSTTSGSSDILGALRALVDFLEQFEEFGFLNEDIPLINVSLNDLLAFAEEFGAALDEVENNPAAHRAGAREQAEGGVRHSAVERPARACDLVDGNILRIDLNFAPALLRVAAGQPRAAARRRRRSTSRATPTCAPRASSTCSLASASTSTTWRNF